MTSSMDKNQRRTAIQLIFHLQEAIRRRCMMSFAFFLQYCMIEDKLTASAIPFLLWPAQEKILPAISGSPRLIILKARQLGLTWLTAAYCLWLVLARPLQLIIIISISEDIAIEFLDRMKFMLSRLPDWITQGRIKSQTTQTITVNHPEGVSVVKSLPTTDFGAQSKTPDLLILDETCWNRSISEIYAASKPGIDAAGGRIIIISNTIKTAPGWSWTRGIFTGALKGENDFTRIFLPWTARPDRPVDFRRRQVREGMDEDDIIEQYPETEEEAISILTGSYFGKVLARHTGLKKGLNGDLARNKLKEIEWTPAPQGILEVWRYPYPELDGYDGRPWLWRYAVGSDVSEGLGQTYSVAYVIDRVHDEIVARMRSNRVDAYQWAELLYLLSCWYDGAVICAERTGAGQTTVKRLAELNANQYVRTVPAKVGGGLTTEIGWHESQEAKHLLCGELKTWLRTMKGTLYDGVLLDECSTWIKHEGTGRLGPEEGHLGDCVIAAGCTVIGAQSYGGAAEKVKPEPTGWLKREIEGRKSVWAA